MGGYTARRDFPGRREWEEQSRERAHAASIAAAEQESLRRVQEKKSTRRRDVESDQTKATIRSARRKVEDLEKEISALEKRIAELTLVLEDPELYTTREGMQKSLVAGNEIEALRKKLDGTLERWTAATEKLEQLAAIT